VLGEKGADRGKLGFIYECMGDAGIEEFKEIAKLVKEYNGKTKEAVGTLLSKM
jgi:hypothetical protein